MAPITAKLPPESRRSRFAVRSERALPVKQPICADGSVDARSEPAVFQVTAFSLQ